MPKAYFAGTTNGPTMSRAQPPIFQLGDFRTLPLYSVKAVTLEEIPQFGKGAVRIEYVDPTYAPPLYGVPEITAIGNDPRAAITAANDWPRHISEFTYYIQIKDDPERRLTKALQSHTELLSDICDSRLGIDPKELWETFDHLLRFAVVHNDYREDPNREEKYDEYAAQLAEAHNLFGPHLFSSQRLIGRIVRQIELKASKWRQMPAIHLHLPAAERPASVRLFYSYSHEDEALRDKLQKHLAILQRQNVIEQWHDRRITAGREWEGQIDQHLEDAHVILLLVSSDFVYSDYCYDVEMKRAMERHEEGTARVIPVILRACDWGDAPFGKLQGLPKDVLAVTSWPNIDEALTDVAKGIRRAVEEIRQAPCGGAKSGRPTAVDREAILDYFVKVLEDAQKFKIAWERCWHHPAKLDHEKEVKDMQTALNSDRLNGGLRFGQRIAPLGRQIDALLKTQVYLDAGYPHSSENLKKAITEIDSLIGNIASEVKSLHNSLDEHITAPRP